MSKTYPHWCKMDHPEIGHSDSEHELCPLCRAINERDELLRVLTDIGFKPQGDAEASADEILNIITEKARSIIATCEASKGGA